MSPINSEKMKDLRGLYIFYLNPCITLSKSKCYQTIFQLKVYNCFISTTIIIYYFPIYSLKMERLHKLFGIFYLYISYKFSRNKYFQN